MANTNYFSGIVKILGMPKEVLVNEQTRIVEVYAEIPQKRKLVLVSLVFCGNLVNVVKDFYKTNDYILIEGYVSIRDKKFSNSNRKKSKQIGISVIKIYPILLHNTSNSKII